MHVPTGTIDIFADSRAHQPTCVAISTAHLWPAACFIRHGTPGYTTEKQMIVCFASIVERRGKGSSAVVRKKSFDDAFPKTVFSNW